MAASDWSTYPTLGGTPMQSWVGKRVAATDHCVAIVRRCARCWDEFVSHLDAATGKAETHCERCR